MAGCGVLRVTSTSSSESSSLLLLLSVVLLTAAAVCLDGAVVGGWLKLNVRDVLGTAVDGAADWLGDADEFLTVKDDDELGDDEKDDEADGDDDDSVVAALCVVGMAGVLSSLVRDVAVAASEARPSTGSAASEDGAAISLLLPIALPPAAALPASSLAVLAASTARSLPFSFSPLMVAPVACCSLIMSEVRLLVSCCCCHAVSPDTDSGKKVPFRFHTSDTSNTQTATHSSTPSLLRSTTASRHCSPASGANDEMGASSSVCSTSYCPAV